MKSRHHRRMFRRQRHRRTTLLAALAIIVAGCAQTVADWTPAATPNDIQVKWVTHEHSISFNSPANLLTNQEARSLDRFLNEIDVRPSDRLFVDVGPQSGDVVSDARIGVINRQLRHFVPGAQAVAISGEKGTDRNIRLIVGRYVVWSMMGRDPQPVWAITVRGTRALWEPAFEDPGVSVNALNYMRLIVDAQTGTCLFGGNSPGPESDTPEPDDVPHPWTVIPPLVAP